MAKQMITTMIHDVEREYPVGTTYEMISREYQNEDEDIIVLAKKNNNLRELRSKLEPGGVTSFVTTASAEGQLVYKRSITLLMLKAVYDLYGKDAMRDVRVLYSVSKGYYCTTGDDIKIDQQFIEKVTARMKELTEQEIPIVKRTVRLQDAIELFEKYGMKDKVKLFYYRRSSTVNLYSINGFEDYFFGYMVPNTSYLKWFELRAYEDGFVILIPTALSTGHIPEFHPQPKLFQVQKISDEWGKMLEINTVGALNDKITKGNVAELILVQEALQEKRIAEIAETISKQPDKKLIMIAGPSSSGKTTFSHRLSVQLMAHGLKPHPIPVDNYFINREATPLDEFGNRDYECLEAIDMKQFNEDMLRLLEGERVELPEYNFVAGVREYKGNYKQLGKDDILVIEGIHCLNDKLSYSLPRENKFKIYISALTQLNVDEHNRIPSTDGRLIRRMVRDARTRGTTAQETIARWYSVRRGEETYIFPYQEEADIMFNSALIYELAVLKQYAEPILFGIDRESEEYKEAKRLLKFLDYFVPVGSENIPMNSILREFVGGGCFNL